MTVLPRRLCHLTLMPLVCCALPVLAGDAPAPAQRVAKAMASAADAEARGDGKALASALRIIDAANPRMLAQAAADPLPAWRASVQGAGSPPYRGRSLGPGYRSGRLGKGGQESFSQVFLSGTGAIIALSAPTGDRLALRVLDPQARPVCEDGSGRGGMCKWIPLFTQRYTIEVTNIGNGDARYFLVVQ